MHEETSSDFTKVDNLVITESLRTNQHSGHILTKLNIKTLTQDNHKQQMTEYNQSANNNCTLTKATNTVVRETVESKLRDFVTRRHDYHKETSTIVMSCKEDNINNNNCDIPSTSNHTIGVGIMSHKNFELSFDHQPSPSSLNSCDTLLSPVEAPFGRRYAEISQFKNHPNIEWSIDDSNEVKEQNQAESFYDDVDTSKPETVMEVTNKEKTDDEDLLLANDNLSKEFFESNAESSSDGGVLAEGEDETSSSESETSWSPSPQCSITLMERLLQTHPVWFLPGLQRGGSVHLLQGKEIGAFIVRGSSQKNTMAISVRLPRDAGPYIEHYLIQSQDGLLNLESSRFKFDSIPALVAHYSNCCDELPVQLSLPRGLREAKNRQQLMSLALLGSEFWRCPIASPEIEETSLNSQIKSPTETSGISTMELTGSLKQKNSILSKLNLRGNNNTNQQLVDTPSDTASSLSSFAVSGGQSQMLSPLSPDNVFITSPTVEFCSMKSSSNSINNLNSPSGIIGRTSTFKAQTFSSSQKIPQNRDVNSDFQQNIALNDVATNKRDDVHIEEFVQQRTRPTPPNTLNLAIASRAPVPPKRWLKPSGSTTSPFVEQNTMQTNNNFTVTTTVTFNVSKQQQQHHTSEIEIPPRNNVPIISERLSPEGGESKTNSDSSLQKWEQAKSSLNQFKNESMRSKRHNGSRRKESKHYQESDILESPSVYCRSNLGDKISDYEDLWTQENNNSRSSLHIALETSSKNNEALTTPMAISPTQLMTPIVGSEVAITTNNSQIITTSKSIIDNNKKSPFYSDPVDVVPSFLQIVRREPKVNLLPTFHRYSEPPKGQFEDLNFHSSPIEVEKGFQSSIIAGSLDHLKAPYKPINNHRLDPTWTVDSSWEFVDADKNDDSSETSSVRNMKQITPQNSLRNRNDNQQKKMMNTFDRQQCGMSVDSYLMNSKKSNVYKMVAKKYPEINLKPSIVPSNAIPSTWQTFDSDCSSKFQRLSSYDNVEQQSVYGGSYQNSAPSEDGTLFSEPWDSSQWDTFMPTTDDSSTIHLSKCRPAISEDETIMEDSSIVSKSHANTIQKNPLINTQKVATVLKHRSSYYYRDREILNASQVEASASTKTSEKINPIIKWFKQLKNDKKEENGDESQQLRQEIDVVPKTELSASRQTLNNINIALQVGESSGESSAKYVGDEHEKTTCCNNKYCCANEEGNDENDEDISISDDFNLESIKTLKTTTTPSIVENLRLPTDNNSENSSIINETDCRPGAEALNYAFEGDEEKTQGKYVCLKKKHERFHSDNSDLFTTTDSLDSINDHSTLNYELLSSIEKRLDSSEYNITNCQIYNDNVKRIREMMSEPPTNDWICEDFNDDKISTRMDADTKTIKEFYRLCVRSHVLIHYLDIKVEVGESDEVYESSFENFIKWLFFRGKEMTEEHLVNKSVWIQAILNFFRKKKHPRNKTEKNDPGDGVEAYTLSLAKDETSIFAKNIYNFIACTRESREKIPHKVMRNIRQFMNGMKNYLVKHGEADFAIEVDKARAALKPDEFLNLDQILEGVMHQLVVLPLKEHLNELFVEYYASRGDIELIINNMKYGESKDPEAFGVKKGLKTPSPQALARISMLFAKLQEAELPFDKLDFLLTAMTTILDSTSDPDSDTNDARHFGCDDFLPLLAYVLCKCGFHFAEIEAEYIWGLMMPTIMNGQAGYYTTALCSAAVSLKEFKQQFDNKEGSLPPNNSIECSVLRIIIPNEYNGSIQTKTIPVRPHTTTRDVCRVIAHKSQITNPMDYGLFKLTDGEETLLMDNDCPQDIRLASAGKHCTLVFRRFDSKIAWPKQ
ncbi:CLUMA_CG006082, isoform A [Clunio marinus]|uniref:CLUMA_CG006082, isoform A n=1 Tax=Clunio marinus TaxID=568069 RepID=A0A1J1HX24_9DIPT|nr:CLUMA_CG006082, isoform A [Clunio marinus]